MTISSLPLSYCTNVHPAMSVAEVDQGLDEFTVPIKKNLGSDLAAGLWLARPVVDELEESPDVLRRFSDRLRDRSLVCYTLNAFPYGNFHSQRVKENVYLPDWSDCARFDYSMSCARVLSKLLPENVEGSLSTVPLGFKKAKRYSDPSFIDDCAVWIYKYAHQLRLLHEKTGRMIRLAIEPEPYCAIETTAETLLFFERLRSLAADAGYLEEVNTHIGLCYDICHQSVEFEDVTESIRKIAAADIRINKIHITCAIEIASPATNLEARQALARYAEPRYLHQTFAKMADGRIVREVDLTESIALNPSDEFRDASAWRIHFHVPVDAEDLGPLSTTRSDLKRALAVVPELDYAPHLEVETYTWSVMPGKQMTSIVDGLTRELQATQRLLSR
ncbi:MAG: hypothetical protein FJ267_00645 [Planctomycetes bacterium]|nr:hypothetical protein [Planctomycetota bacterium]